MQGELFFDNIFKSLIAESKEFVIEYSHKWRYFKDERYISYYITGVNGYNSSYLFRARVKSLCKEGLDILKENLLHTDYEHRVGYLEIILEEFSQFKDFVKEKEKIDEESEWGPEVRHKFIGFVNPKFKGAQSANPDHKDSIEYEAKIFANAWLETIEETKSKIEFLINQIELLPEPKSTIKDKNTIQVFYSWQSDNEHERQIIWKGLRKAEAHFKKSGKALVIESDMRGVPGSQNIPNELFKKIVNSDIFVADVNLIGKSLFRADLIPNPNVLIELGYAACSLGWDRIIMVQNTENHKIEDLPFDIRQRSVLWYKSDSVDDLATKLQFAISSIVSNATI